jgi:hypothetical protein
LNAGLEQRRVRPEGFGEAAGDDAIGPIPLEAHLDEFAQKGRKHPGGLEQPGGHLMDAKPDPERFACHL